MKEIIFDAAVSVDGHISGSRGDISQFARACEHVRWSMTILKHAGFPGGRFV
jgi:hypothetical protein